MMIYNNDDIYIIINKKNMVLITNKLIINK